MNSSCQLGMEGIAKNGSPQLTMLGEFNAKSGRKDGLIDVNEWMRQKENEPLDGQVGFDGEVVKW